MTTVKQIFDRLQSITLKKNGYGEYDYSELTKCQNNIDLIMPFIPVGTFADKVITSNTTCIFSEKQLWVIAYELIKNNDYVAQLESSIIQSKKEAIAKKDATFSKIAANKSASSDVLAAVKSAGKKLGDYYKWLNTYGNEYRSEFFSKKYSQNSVNSFLAIA
jgi:hypothetical protein